MKIKCKCTKIVGFKCMYVKIFVTYPGCAISRQIVCDASSWKKKKKEKFWLG